MRKKAPVKPKPKSSGSQLKTSTTGYCPGCNHPYIVQADGMGVVHYVCEKCGKKVVKNKFDQVANPFLIAGTGVYLVICLIPIFIFLVIIFNFLSCLGSL